MVVHVGHLARWEYSLAIVVGLALLDLCLEYWVGGPSPAVGYSADRWRLEAYLRRWWTVAGQPCGDVGNRAPGMAGQAGNDKMSMEPVSLKFDCKDKYLIF